MKIEDIAVKYALEQWDATGQDTIQSNQMIRDQIANGVTYGYSLRYHELMAYLKAAIAAEEHESFNLLSIEEFGGGWFRGRINALEQIVKFMESAPKV